MYTRFVSGALFPLHERLKGHSTVAVLGELEKSQFLPRPALDDLQAARLRRLIEQAATRVPYYQALFAERGIDWRGIGRPADLTAVPLLTKAEIRRAGDSLRSVGHGPLTSGTTSGSTGESLKFYLGRERISHDVAGRWRATRWWGVDFGDPEVVFWASPIEAGAQDRWRQLRDRLLRSHFIDARDLSDDRVEAIFRRMQAVDPLMIYGYTSAIARLAGYAQKRGLGIRLPRLRVVFVTAAKLMQDQRQRIGEVFNAPVADCYGGRDAGIVSNECPHGGMHISEEDVVVEIVDDAGNVLPPGQLGEIVVTHLASSEFPFIRYRTGDRGMLGDTVCGCGRQLRKLLSIEGRMNDLLVGPQGRVMHHTGISNLLKDVAGLVNYKVVQEAEDFIRVQIVSTQQLSASDRERIDGSLKAQLGAGMRAEIERVADIQPEASGKHRYIVNRVRQPA